MATLCTLTGVLRDRQNTAVASTEISFAFKNGVVGSGDVYTPVIETTTTDGSGNISIQLTNGSYTGTMLSNGRIETFTLNVPDAASADIGDYIDQDVDQTPALLAQAVAAKDAAEAAAATLVVLGTVSQSGGVPTGAITERGSNANGEYMRLADGTQICTFSLTTSASGGVGWTFPAAFAAAPSVQGTANNASARIVAVDSIGATSSNVNGYNATPVRFAFDAMLIAVGRWF